ncbi:E3 ubiquitin-protein ligase rnf8-like isoform X4 [Branchiostoma floridae]|uniref:E3 ubiquitin-protein ligase rnf8-like isoform X4 n=1 Tax=Branchiostoma floridae TaxID=7739 RepID=A0A9J7N7B1_BRAFL|nr:E3 ubiquitin-protein ligase rnf8-like isoform X4 [Branchiostoma floridae]
MITMAEVQNLVWFLRRQYKDAEETIALTGRQEVSLGRGLDVTHRTIPKDTPFDMFSRKHAIFRPAVDGTWTVQDNNVVRLEEEKHQMQAELQEMMTREMQQKEQELLERLEQQGLALQEEKQQVEARLQQQLAQQLEEKDKDLEEQLLKHKAALDQIISQKEREHSDLQAKLLQSKLEKEQQEQSVKKVREEVVENVTNVMESELQCNICTELFVQATTLHCSHTFCYACILEWTKTRKMECPTCRTKVTSQTRSLVLDSYIDKMVESYSEELKQHRMALLQDRKEKVATLERQSPRQGKDSPISVGSASSDEEPLSVSSGGSSGSQWTQSSSSSTHNSPPHSRGNSASMDNDFVPGDPMAYYGGYGRCHICGRRGHWAPGCPYRLRF